MVAAILGLKEISVRQIKHEAVRTEEREPAYRDDIEKLAPAAVRRYAVPYTASAEDKQLTRLPGIVWFGAEKHDFAVRHGYRAMSEEEAEPVSPSGIPFDFVGGPQADAPVVEEDEEGGRRKRRGRREPK